MRRNENSWKIHFTDLSDGAIPRKWESAQSGLAQDGQRTAFDPGLGAFQAVVGRAGLELRKETETTKSEISEEGHLEADVKVANG